jgi:hypothetical protein
VSVVIQWRLECASEGEFVTIGCRDAGFLSRIADGRLSHGQNVADFVVEMSIRRDKRIGIENDGKPTNAAGSWERVQVGQIRYSMLCRNRPINVVRG